MKLTTKKWLVFYNSYRKCYQISRFVDLAYSTGVTPILFTDDYIIGEIVKTNLNNKEL